MTKIVEERKEYTESQSVNGTIGAWMRKAKAALTPSQYGKLVSELAPFTNEEKLAFTQEIKPEKDTLIARLKRGLSTRVINTDVIVDVDIDVNTNTVTSSLTSLPEIDFNSLPNDIDGENREVMYKAIGTVVDFLEHLSQDFDNPKIRALFPWWSHLKSVGKHPNMNSVKELIKRTDSAEVSWIAYAISYSISNDYAGVIEFKKPNIELPSDHPDGKRNPNQILTNGQEALAEAILDGKIKTQ